MAVWRIQSLHLSRTESRYLVGSMTYGVVWDQVYGMLRQPALPESRAFTAYTGDDTAINGAGCYLPDRVGHLFQCRPTPPSDIMQPGDRRLHWLPIAVDGAIYRTITSDRPVTDYGLHGLLCVLLCGINRTRDLVVQFTGKAPATVAHTMLQPVLDEARLAAQTCMLPPDDRDISRCHVSSFLCL